MPGMKQNGSAVSRMWGLHPREVWARRGSWVVAAAAAMVSTACAPPPSFAVRWRITDDASQEAPPLLSATQCSEVGIGSMRIDTFEPAGGLIDRRRSPCFPNGFGDEQATVDGPALPNGLYSIEVRGLNRDGDPWDDVITEEPRVVTRRDIEVVGELVVVDDLVIEAPLPCEDTMDNDRDGLVDLMDPACQANVFGPEDQQFTNLQLLLTVSFLSQNPNASCIGLGVSEIMVQVDDSMLPPIACTTDPVLMPVNLNPGPHTVAVVAMGADGMPRTVEHSFTVSVAEGARLLTIDADFSAADFVPALLEATSFLINFVGHEGELGTRGCAPNPGSGNLQITDVSVRARDAHGGPAMVPVVIASGTAGSENLTGTALDGALFPCPTSIVRTGDLPWGGYLLDIEGRSAAGEVCFTTGAQAVSAAPGATFLIAVPRVTDPLPASCVDCGSDADCGGGSCVNQMCTGE